MRLTWIINVKRVLKIQPKIFQDAETVAWRLYGSRFYMDIHKAENSRVNLVIWFEVRLLEQMVQVLYNGLGPVL